jgi:hypothetical protein
MNFKRNLQGTFVSAHLNSSSHLRVTRLVLSGRGGIYRIDINDVVDFLLEQVNLVLDVGVLVVFLAMLCFVLLKNMAEDLMRVVCLTLKQ